MSESEQIRELAVAGQTVAQIARILDIRYQFAYNVCQKAGLLNGPDDVAKSKAASLPEKTTLTAGMLRLGGFETCGNFTLTTSGLALPIVPKRSGVYAFVVDGVVQYVGVAARSLAQRLYGYARPGPSQITNQRLNELLIQLISEGSEIEIYHACPCDFEWNGFVVNGAVGLEAGIISSHLLPWNIRGA
ncbi:GIY-YIG nuclease family protein [Nostoc sp. CHAB 5834]|nr:GIY-YIG nuclease family protein [Nostoc sp. CHAB 5834]